LRFMVVSGLWPRSATRVKMALKQGPPEASCAYERRQVAIMMNGL
jgi:hypothetical protein